MSKKEQYWGWGFIAISFIISQVVYRFSTSYFGDVNSLMKEPGPSEIISLAAFIVSFMIMKTIYSEIEKNRRGS